MDWLLNVGRRGVKQVVDKILPFVTQTDENARKGNMFYDNFNQIDSVRQLLLQFS